MGSGSKSALTGVALQLTRIPQRNGTKAAARASCVMAYRVFTAPAETNSRLPKKPGGEAVEFRRFRDALNWARSLGQNMRAVLIIDEQTPAKVIVRSREDAARTTP
jgi:hypothetical protein